MKFFSSPKKVLRAVFLLYIISLCLPGIVYDAHQSAGMIETLCSPPLNSQLSPEQCRESLLSSHETRTDWGFSVLFGGMFAAFIGIYAWFSNLLFLIGYQLAKKKKYIMALVFALGAFLLGLQAFMLNTWLLDEGGVMEATIKYFSIGYYVWLASFLVLVCYSYTQFKKVGAPVNSSNTIS